MLLTKYVLDDILVGVSWDVEFADEFKAEFDVFDADVQDELLSHIPLLEKFGPQVRRPRVDTLNDSEYPNMKELRFAAADGEWRVAFAFDPRRKAILLVGGDKSKMTQKRFYAALIRKADERYAAHLNRIKREKKKNKEKEK